MTGLDCFAAAVVRRQQARGAKAPSGGRRSRIVGQRERAFVDQDIGAISAFFCLSNRLANLIGIRPNDEFYRIGREF